MDSPSLFSKGWFSARLQPILLGMGFVVLIGMSAATAWLVQRAGDDARMLNHTIIVQDKLSNVLLNTRRAESGQRGYMLTGRPAYLDDFASVEPEVDSLLAELLRLTADNPERQRQIEAMGATSKEKFAEMRRVLAFQDAGDLERARTEVLTGQGRALMNRLRQQTEAAIAAEGKLLEQRTAQSARTNQALLAVALLGAVVVVLLGGLSVVLVQRNARQREEAQTELASINANLERIVEFRTADLTEANEEIQRFAYIVSHDLRSPLVNIMGFTSELEALRQDIFNNINKLQSDLAALTEHAEVSVQGQGQTDETTGGTIDQLGHDFDEAIRFIKTSIGNMDRLINAVLKLSREGRRQFRPEAIEMDAVIDSIVQTVTHRAAELGAQIDVEPLPPVESDRLAIDQIFSNLVDNALKYGRTDVPLRIQVRGRATATRVIYEVSDNGRGIAPHDHQRVFELFRRSGVQDRPGEGIGLAHVRALVRRMGGTMGLKSELGQGSTFSVTLPRRWSVESRSA